MTAGVTDLFSSLIFSVICSTVESKATIVNKRICLPDPLEAKSPKNIYGGIYGPDVLTYLKALPGTTFKQVSPCRRRGLNRIRQSETLRKIILSSADSRRIRGGKKDFERAGTLSRTRCRLVNITSLPVTGPRPT
jgi:hypothetical protein